MSEDRGIVIVHPRCGITAHEIAEFLRDKFQTPGKREGSPLTDASIRVLEDHDR